MGVYSEGCALAPQVVQYVAKELGIPVDERKALGILVHPKVARNHYGDKLLVGADASLWTSTGPRVNFGPGLGYGCGLLDEKNESPAASRVSEGIEERDMSWVRDVH